MPLCGAVVPVKEIPKCHEAVVSTWRGTLCTQQYFLFLSVFVQMGVCTDLTILNFLFIFGNYIGLTGLWPFWGAVLLFFFFNFSNRIWQATSQRQDGHEGLA